MLQATPIYKPCYFCQTGLSYLSVVKSKFSARRNTRKWQEWCCQTLGCLEIQILIGVDKPHLSSHLSPALVTPCHLWQRLRAQSHCLGCCWLQIPFCRHDETGGFKMLQDLEGGLVPKNGAPQDPDRSKDVRSIWNQVWRNTRWCTQGNGGKNVLEGKPALPLAEEANRPRKPRIQIHRSNQRNRTQMSSSHRVTDHRLP